MHLATEGRRRQSSSFQRDAGQLRTSVSKTDSAISCGCWPQSSALHMTFAVRTGGGKLEATGNHELSQTEARKLRCHKTKMHSLWERRSLRQSSEVYSHRHVCSPVIWVKKIFLFKKRQTTKPSQLVHLRGKVHVWPGLRKGDCNKSVAPSSIFHHQINQA